MAILGYNTKGALSLGFATGFKVAAPFVLGSAQTMTELHGWFGAGTGANVILHIHADSAGSPGARLAYTSPLALTGVDVDLSQSGFSLSLAAGTYWIGFTSDTAGSPTGQVYREGSGGSYKGKSSGATFNPPSDPFGSTDVSSATRLLSVWAVVGSPAPTSAERVGAVQF